MFEHAWPCEPAVFSDMTNQDCGNVAALCFLHKAVRAASHLHNRAWRRTKRWVGNGLDAVDHEQLGLYFVECSNDVGERWL